MRRRRAFTKLATYVPMDEFLARPRTRILRSLSVLGWTSAEDLFDVLNLPDRHEDPARNAYTAQLARLVDARLVEQRGERFARGVSGSAYEYRLAPGVDIRVPPPTLRATPSRLKEGSQHYRLIKLAIERPAT